MIIRIIIIMIIRIITIVIIKPEIVDISVDGTTEDSGGQSDGRLHQGQHGLVHGLDKRIRSIRMFIVQHDIKDDTDGGVQGDEDWI